MSDFCYSTNEEEFRDDEQSVIHEVIESCPEPDLAIGIPYWRAKSVKPKPSEFFNVDWLIEDIQERAMDEHGEYAEDFLTDIPQTEINELDKIISDWLDNNANVPFYRVEGIEECNITEEMVNKYKEIYNAKT